LGGLSKKAFQLDKLKLKKPLPHLTLDSGGLLFKGHRLPYAMQEQNTITAEAIVDAYTIMAYDGVGISGRDLAAGLDFLIAMQERSRFPWLSANLVDKASNTPLFTPYIKKTSGPLEIAVIGITGTDAGGVLKKSDRGIILPWRKVLPSLAAKLAKENDLVVLLSSSSSFDNRAIAEEVPEIHIIFQAASGVPFHAPKQVGNTIICQAEKQGKSFGVLQVNWQPSKVWHTDESGKLLTQKQNELRNINVRLSRYEQRLPSAERQTHWGYQQLLQIRDQVQEEIERLKTDTIQKQSSKEVPSTLKNRLIAMEISLPDDKKVLDIVEEAKRKVNELSRKNAAANRNISGQPSLPKTARSIPLPYAGVTTCSGCHRPQADFWEKTHHAGAYRTLVENRQNHNPDCLSCHVTDNRGNRTRSLVLLPDELRQVGCETCHGPGGAHAENQGNDSIIRHPAAATCIGCHTKERDDSFNYENDVKRIACPAS
jgi:2',3'-cyclic-nucleotide 2'-phosphodiesterase (5'-nucleotidase family)